MRISDARGGSGRGAVVVVVEDDSGTGLVLGSLLGLDPEESEGWERLYLVVIRVWVEEVREGCGLGRGKFNRRGGGGSHCSRSCF